MPAPQIVLDLVERFERNGDAYKSPSYNETQLRREFLDPFFEALGWDVNNRQGYAEAYKDVIHEDAIKIGGATKAPDYSFRIGGTRKFFVEAKKPSVNIRDDIAPAFQLRRYAWSAKLPLSILTDFEELAVYDCRIKPDKNDKSSTARTGFFTCEHYAEKWDEIAAVFSRDAVLKGSFDKYAESRKAKKGTAEVDSAFLAEIEKWRDLLARNIALRNTSLTTRELNFSVQRTIDRLIFLRICEDRGIEDYGALRKLTNGVNVYPRLREIYYRADARYNSGLFHFRIEKDVAEAPDKLTLDLVIDDKPLKEILRNLYYPDSPYEFAVLPADILGQVYEQFLGKVIRLTAGHHAVVEDKPEVKKAGGVFYTPTYIVEYIVRNTVGRLLGDQGSGVRDRGDAKGGFYDKDLSGYGSLEKGDGSGGGNLPDNKALSEGRDVCLDEPDTAGSNIDPGQHSGRSRTATSSGLSEISFHIEGFAHGDRNTFADSDEAGLHHPGTDAKGLGHLSGSRQDVERIDTVSKKKSLTPDPRPLTPKDVAKFRILDPACGSGSFLLGAYQYLLDWHLRWYSENDPTRWTKAKQPALYQGYGGAWRLTTAERKHILLNNIYGVDIDSQAVEVTKLSLLLKVLEGETGESINKQLSFFHERALPDLSSNIKCGNSLIGPDFYDQKQLSFIDEEERYRVNVFDWEAEFADVFKAGGFDAVIGNPPYVRQELLGDDKTYFQQHYKTYHGVADLYVYFIEKGIQLLRKGGVFGVIVANKWMKVSYGEPLRRWMKGEHIDEITDFVDMPVFKGATTYTCILRINKHEPHDTFMATQVATLDFPSLADYVSTNRYSVSLVTLDDKGWSLANEGAQNLQTRLQSLGVSLKEYVKGKIYRGVLTGLNEAFVIDRETRDRLIAEDPKSAEVLKPFLVGKDIKRYQPLHCNRFVIFTRRGVDIRRYPAIERHLTAFKSRLMPKPKDWLEKESQEKKWPGRKPGHYQWYEIQDTVEYFAEFDKHKILWPGISAEVAAFALDEAGYYGNDNNQLIVSGDRYLLGILNSRLTRFLLTQICDKVQGGFYRLKIVYVRQLPIRTINFSVPADKARHDRLVQLVEQMLALHKQLAETRTGHDTNSIERQVDATDRQIDRLVYELYALTEEEIAVVEGR